MLSSVVLGGLNECGVIQRDSSDICDRNAMFIFNNWVEAKVTDEEIERLAKEWCLHDDKHYTLAQFGRHKIARYESEEGFKAGFRACQEQMRWISVKERLPEKGICVLVCNPKSISPTYGWYYDDNMWAINDEPNEDLRKIDHVSFVTHWLPLPEAPDVEGEK